MDRNVDEVINDLQKAIEAYKEATAQYINEKKHRLTQGELEHRLEEFRVNSPFLSNIFTLTSELEAYFLKLGVRFRAGKN